MASRLDAHAIDRLVDRLVDGIADELAVGDIDRERALSFWHRFDPRVGERVEQDLRTRCEAPRRRLTLITCR